MTRIIGYFSFLVLILLILTQVGVTECLRKIGEKGQNNQGISEKQAPAVDNRVDLDHLSDLLLCWNNYRLSEDRNELAKIQQLIIEELRRDMVETLVQEKQARKETGQSKQEISSDQRESKDDRRRLTDANRRQENGDNIKRGIQICEDRGDLRDDPGNFRDDVCDQEKAESILNRKREIAGELVNLQSQIDSGSDNSHLFRETQNDLLQDYLMLSKKEINMGYREFQDDRLKLREDRREVQKDHRSR